MHKKEFWILTNKCGNNLTHKNEAEWPCWQVENSVSRDVITGKVKGLFIDIYRFVKVAIDI